MPNHTTSSTQAIDALTWTHLSADDVAAWAELTNVLAVADQTDEFYDAEDLAEELAESGFTPELDSWAVWSGSHLIGFGQLRVAVALDADGAVRCQLDGGVHPQWRGHGVGRQLMDRMEQRGRELAAQRHPGAPAYYRASGGVEGASVRNLLTHRGYTTARYFHDLRLRLPAVQKQTRPIEGVELASPMLGDAETVRLAHNQAFADHWGSTAISSDRWGELFASRTARLPLSTVACDADGRVLSYVLVAQWVDREAYVNLVGTVPDARGRGLAQVCLHRSLELIQNSGVYDLVDLEVDADSPTGATRIYERLGFAPLRVRSTMILPA